MQKYNIRKTCPVCTEEFIAQRDTVVHCSRMCSQITLRGKSLASFSTRFWQRVQRSEECWEWTTPHRSGYGFMHCPMSRKRERAHRISWMLTYGSIPDGLHVLHHCDNPPCVRPEHLHLGTHPENMAEASERRLFRYGHDWLASHGEYVRLSPEIVLEIHARYSQGGISQRALAAEYGVSKSTLGYALKQRVSRLVGE